MSVPVIDARELRKTYQVGGQEIRALDGVDVYIETGEMLSITGASGSGKSTLMQVLGCLDRADSGRYLLDGEDVSTLTGDRLAAIRSRKIGFVFQGFHLLPRLSALENVELPLLYAGIANPRALAEAAVERVGLASRRHHEPNQLSGGQRQRVAVARALVASPSLILADEPTGNLDSRTGAEILTLFRELNNEGRTIIIVTHDPEVAKCGNREIQVRDGRVIRTTASTRLLLENPGVASQGA
ncbi:MAG: ABC transporter ATP-binding protein [Planctomycetota bacterium]|jgi:putative ABC transport system ATP-binding protein|nr:ABC transporter ATP-binding protein [Planctomycetota bacterium]